MNFLIVFDTCTHARYYGDVHEVLSLPTGASIRYEYKRRLFSEQAAQLIDELAGNPGLMPVPTLLMYGQKIGFQQGDPEPKTMLRLDDSIFVPTRCAYLEAVAIGEAAEGSEEVLYLHFRLTGFIDPATPILGELVQALQTGGELPFGDQETEYSWISMLPESLLPRSAELMSEDQAPWTQVIDRLIQDDTQFRSDVYWRVLAVSEFKSGATHGQVLLSDRESNERVHANRYRRDYNLFEGRRYAVEVQSYSPGGHGHLVPAGASLAMTSRDDDQGVLSLSADPLEIVPNQVDTKRFSISLDSSMETRFAGLHLETQVPGYVSSYPAGSMCTLTFSLRKDRFRLFGGILLVLFAAGLGIAAAFSSVEGPYAVILGVSALFVGAIGAYLLTSKFSLNA